MFANSAIVVFDALRVNVWQIDTPQHKLHTLFTFNGKKLFWGFTALKVALQHIFGHTEFSQKP